MTEPVRISLFEKNPQWRRLVTEHAKPFMEGLWQRFEAGGLTLDDDVALLAILQRVAEKEPAR